MCNQMYGHASCGKTAMGPAASTALGLLTGLVVFLAMAFTGVIAVNGTNNPGISPIPSAAAGSTGEASAVDSNPGSLRSLDLNRDGQLSLAEAAGYADIVTRFDRADRNRDGKLSAAEFERLSKVPPAKAKGKAKVARKASRRDEATAASGC
jgi:hypothetical protein